MTRVLPVISLALLLVPIADRALAAGDPVLVGAGDIATCNGPGDEATAKLLDNIPGTVFTLGDNVYNSGTPLEFARCYEPSWGRHKGRTRPAPGNHDYRTPAGAGYYTYFGAAAGPPGRGYYSYNLGAWHIVVLNSNCVLVACRPGSPQEQWLRADLAAHPAECTLAYWHHARFSSDRNHGNYGTMAPIFDVLYRFGAEVILSGHAHDYERFAPQTSGGRADPSHGVRQIVVGTGGNSHYPFGPPIANSDVRNASTFGVLKLTLHPGSYDWHFIPQAGATFTDSGTGTCHGRPPPPPPRPPTSPTTARKAPKPRAVPPPTATTAPPTTTTTTKAPTRGGIAFRDADSSASDIERTSVTVDRPPGTAVGDVMVASVAVNDSDPAITPPSGWTLIRKDSIQATVHQEIYYRVATASDPSSYKWTLTGPGRRLVAGIAAYSGVDTAHPVDADDANLDTSNSATPTAPSVTTSTPGALLLAVIAVNSDGVISPPSGMKQRWQRIARFSPRSMAAEWSDVRLGAAGPTGRRTASSSAAGKSIAAVVALRPAR